MVSGGLYMSVEAWLHIQHGPGVYETRVGPVDVVYSRIHELGGWTGRRHATYLPRRPYMAPTQAGLTESGTLTRAATQAFERKVGG
jgi:hypothetical protein